MVIVYYVLYLLIVMMLYEVTATPKRFRQFSLFIKPGLGVWQVRVQPIY